MDKKISLTQQTVKGSALYIAGLFTSLGSILIITDDKEVIGAVFLMLGAMIYLAREYMLKK